jgi:hypothetical protein
LDEGEWVFLEKPQTESNAGGCCKKADQYPDVNQQGIQKEKW